MTTAKRKATKSKAAPPSRNPPVPGLTTAKAAAFGKAALEGISDHLRGVRQDADDGGLTSVSSVEAALRELSSTAFVYLGIESEKALGHDRLSSDIHERTSALKDAVDLHISGLDRDNTRLTEDNTGLRKELAEARAAVQRALADARDARAEAEQRRKAGEDAIAHANGIREVYVRVLADVVHVLSRK